jgi:signal transduction histidine kinase/CheY-like chemotaxis protein/HAMP domain-containing protein
MQLTGSRPASRRFGRFPLIFKLNVMFSLASALGIGLVVALHVWSQIASTNANAYQHNTEIADLVAAHVSDRVARNLQVLRAFAADPRLVSTLEAGDLARLTLGLQAVAPSEPELAGLRVVDTDGRIIATSLEGTAGIGRLFTTEHQVRVPLDLGVPGVGVPTLGQSSQLPVVPIGVPIWGAEGRVIGVLVGPLSLDRLSDRLGDIRIGQAGFVSMFAADGTVLTHPDSRLILQPRRQESWVTEAALRGQPSAGRSENAYGVPMLSVAVPIPELGWVVEAQLPSDELYAPFWAGIARDAVAAIVALLIAIGIGSMVATRLTSPLHTLQAAAHQIATGSYGGTPVDVTSGDELEDLARDFDRMSDALARQAQERDAAEAALSDQAKHRETLVRMARHLAVEGDAERLLETLLNAAVHVTGTADGGVARWDSGAQVLRQTHSYAPSENVGAILGSTSASGRAATERRAIIINDYQRFLGNSTPAGRSGAQAVLAVPLVHEGALLGTISVGSPSEAKQFSAADAETLEVLAGIAAAVLARLDASDLLTMHVARLDELTRLSQVVVSSLAVDEVLAEVARATATLLKAPAVSFWVVDEQRRSLELRAFSDDELGSTQEFRQAAFGEGGAGWVAEHRERLLVDDVFADGRTSGLAWWRQHGLRSSLTIPVMDGQQVVAVLSANGRTPFRLSPSDEDILTMFVSQAAIAVRNASLYETASQTNIALEEALLQANELAVAAEDGARVKSEFLATMSHEIRTPLNGVIGLSQLLVGMELGAKERTYADLIHRSGQTLLALINDILDFSKIEAGRLDLEHTDVTMRTVVQDAIGLLSFAAQSKGLRLHAAIDDDVPTTLLGDPGRLNQVLINLIGNAIKFTATGGVTVRVQSHEAPDGCVSLRVEVRDTGIGIDAVGQARLFQPFSQADTSTSRHYGGTGLGLAICHRLVEQMGGEIGVDSQSGAGSTFWFTVKLGRVDGRSAESGAPVADRTRAASGPGAAPLGDGADRTARPDLPVLLVDDSPINRIVGHDLLERLGYRSEVVSSGSEAILAVSQRAYAAVLLDCHMADIDGFAATAEIRLREGTGRRVPIIAMTADTLPSTRRRCLEMGMDDFLVKPFSQEALAEVVYLWTMPTGVGRTPPIGDAAPAVAAPAAPMNGAVTPAPVPTPTAADVSLRPAVDRSAMLRIAGELGVVDSGLVAELVRLFMDGSPEHLVRLREAIDARDRPTYHRIAHTIKGEAAMIGAYDLAGACERLESLAVAERDAPEPDALLPESLLLLAVIEAEFARAADELRPLLVA